MVAGRSLFGVPRLSRTPFIPTQHISKMYNIVFLFKEYRKRWINYFKTFQYNIENNFRVYRDLENILCMGRMIICIYIQWYQRI